MNKRSLLNAALNMENSPLPKMEREIMLGRELHKITKLKGLTNPIVTPNMMRA